MKEVIEKREISIDNKIFTKDDVMSLIRLFNKLSNEILDKSKEIKGKELIQEGWKESNITERYIDTSHSSLELSASDNSKYIGTYEEILQANGILDNKKIVGISLYFTEHVFDSKFIIRIEQSKSDFHLSSNYAEVEGQDRIWVDGTIKNVEDFFSNCRNQSMFVKKLQYLIMAFTVLILILFLRNLIELFIKTKLIFPRIMENLFTKDWIFFIIVSSLITLAPAVFIYNWLVKLFPRIEIQTDKDIQQIGKEKCIKLWLIASIIIIPTIISFVLRLYYK
jgi:hypothetical protein